ncbi:MAG: sporulation protein YqfD [Lachnospiraceae bacterium]|nr:sporulation protein YqfD [Lachnospiraceae bacterium]
MNSYFKNGSFLRLKLEGQGVERFFTLCGNRHIPLWNIQADGKYCYANIHYRDWEQGRELLLKTGTQAAIVRKHGLPFLLPGLKTRALFGIAGLMAVAWLWYSTQLIWHIEFEGNYSITEDQLTDFMAERGIWVGVRKSSLDLETLEKELRQEFPLITWTSGKINGTVLEISIKENERPNVTLPVLSVEEATGLYATADGVMISVYVRNGISLVSRGDEVHQGDLLVDGRIPVLNEEGETDHYLLYEADADILIETVQQVSYSLDKVYVAKEYTGRKGSGVWLSLNQILYRLPQTGAGWKEKEQLLEPSFTVTLFGRQLGFGFFEAKEYQNVEKSYTPQEAEALLRAEFEKNNLILEEKGVQIISENVTMEENENFFLLRGEMTVRYAAVESKIITEEVSKEIDDTEGL